MFALVVVCGMFVFMPAATAAATTAASAATAPTEEHPDEGEDHPGRDVVKRSEEIDLRDDE